MWFVNMYKNKIMKMGQLLKIYVKNKRPKYRHVFLSHKVQHFFVSSSTTSFFGFRKKYIFADMLPSLLR